MFVGNTLSNIRILHGYTRKQLAELLNITEQAVWQYENGYMSPKMEIVNELKKIFSVKSRYFYNEDLLSKNNDIKINQNHIAYRATTINSVQKTQFEAKHVEFVDAFLRLVEKKIHYPKNEIVQLREKAIEIMNDDGFERKENIKRIANYAREFLDLNNKGNGSLLFMLEKKGAFVYEKAIGEKIDAYSVWSDNGKPYIILGNIKKSAVRRNFDLAHELGHLLLHYKVEFGVLDKMSYREYENEANLFASIFLLPEEEFINDFNCLAKKSNPDSYLDLKKKWLVSIQALAHRAYSLGLINYQQYRYFNIMINKNGYKVNEPLDSEIKIIKPGKIKSILQLLFEKDHLSLNTLLDTLMVDTKFFTKILGIEETFFENYSERKFRQFTLSDLTFKTK
ncbi:helix-turn-helix domain-containing protein [Tepidibacillus infernus]|uniref:Transcriptional regulator n=1 Tax=Tepidibacillus decaturensis TaxID=1413211 RepID=A0A135L6N1_9BACI|nr:XRE family transcriptional regulator [Tepidibacillus decaturensis]KXG44589.1 transcriptional regulator [Tepidibacillus decaturensis]